MGSNYILVYVGEDKEVTRAIFSILSMASLTAATRLGLHELWIQTFSILCHPLPYIAILNAKVLTRLHCPRNKITQGDQLVIVMWIFNSYPDIRFQCKQMTSSYYLLWEPLTRGVYREGHAKDIIN